MKKALYNLINKLGYRIENKSKSKKRDIESLKRFNISENFDLIYKSREFINKIQEKFPDFKIKNHENGFILNFNGISIYVESVEEFYIINEVFVEEEYNFKTSDKIILIDIGTNIGIASLYFSTLPNVNKIYCFEPVLDTYKQAKFNFSMNENTSKVIEFTNVGLGKDTRDETFIFDKQVKGNTGIRGQMSSSYSNNSNSISIDVKIKNAADEIQRIIDSNPDSKIVIKMDCEGAEYEIFETLTSSLISAISIFMIEWHDKGSSSIENKLLENGFHLFLKNLAPNAGIIYASKG